MANFGELLIEECLQTLKKKETVSILKTSHAIVGYHWLVKEGKAVLVEEFPFVERFKLA